MKSRRRHELQENVLAIEIGKIAQFLKDKGSHLATGVLVLALIALGWVFFSRRSQAKQVGYQQQWDRAMSGQLKDDERIDILTALAEQTDNDRLAALAGVELGYEYAVRILTAKTNSERSALAEKASQWYRLTIQKFPKQELALAKACYGLGKLSESSAQFERARDEYRKVKSFGNLAGHPVVHLAELALAQLKALQQPMRMATTAPSSTQPTTAPATRPTTQPASQPAGAAASRPAKTPAP